MSGSIVNHEALGLTVAGLMVQMLEKIRGQQITVSTVDISVSGECLTVDLEGYTTASRASIPITPSIGA